MSFIICYICRNPTSNQPSRDETGATSFEIGPCCGGELEYDDATPEAEGNYRIGPKLSQISQMKTGPFLEPVLFSRCTTIYFGLAPPFIPAPYKILRDSV